MVTVSDFALYGSRDETEAMEAALEDAFGSVEVTHNSSVTTHVNVSGREYKKQLDAVKSAIADAGFDPECVNRK